MGLSRSSGGALPAGSSRGSAWTSSNGGCASDPSSADGTDSSELATLSVTGIDALETTFARYLPQVVLAVLVPLAVLVLVAAIDLTSAAVMLLTLPLVPVFMWLIGRYTEHRARERWQALALLAGHFADVVRGLPTLRAFNRARAQAEQIELVSDRYRVATMGTLRLAFLSGTVLELAATIGVALVAVTVGVRLVDGGLGLQAGLTVLVLAPELYLPIRNVAAQFHASADGAAVAGRLLDLVEEPAGGAAPRRAPSRTCRRRRSGSSRCRSPIPAASIRHSRRSTSSSPPESPSRSSGRAAPERAPWPHSFCASRHRRTGRLLVDDVDLAACDPQAWRSRLAWLPQRPTLLRTTVAENIRLGDPGATVDRLYAAAALAGADRFVRGLPDGYETVVGDGGRPLSPGQIRRIAMARAFLRNAPLLILDEPTADLDPESAEIVGDAIDRFLGRCTLLLITHRAGLAARCDRVVRLELGSLVEPVAEAVA